MTTFEEYEGRLNAVYREREHLVALVAAIYPSRLVPATAEDWAIVYIDLPTGQFSRHIAEANRDLFDHVPLAAELAADLWDGHTSEESYRRVDALTAILAPLKEFPEAPSVADRAGA